MERWAMSLWESENALAIVALCLFLVLLSMLAVFGWEKEGGCHGKRVAPGPPAWPIVGHLHLMSNKQPFHRTLWSLAQRYGPIMHLQLGCRPVLVVSSSHVATQCFTINDKVFASRPTFAAGELLGYNHTMLGFHPYGPRWQNLRKISTAELLSPARIQSAKHIRREELSNTVRSLFHSCALHDGRGAAVNLRGHMEELTCNVILRMLTHNHHHFANPAEAQQFREILNEVVFLLGVFNVGDYIPWLRWLDVQGWQRAMKRLHRRSDPFVQRLLDQSKTSDFIDALISSMDGDSLVKATALGLIIAATETSASSLEWGLSAMVKHPEVCKRAQEELDAKVGRDRVVEESDLPALEYVEAIVKETLRLYPPGPLLVPHMSTEACRVGGYFVPAGTRLLVNAWAIHRDPAAWERPLEFEPRRFLEEAVDGRGKDLKYIPFGSGRRGCPGAPLAMCLLQLSMARLLQAFDWGGEGVVDMDERFGMSLLRATIKPRLPSHLYQIK